MENGLFSRWQPEDKATGATWALLALIVAVGAGLRFWGLGNIGLHGDEDVMAMATRTLREAGWPVLPSGMEYVRGLPQLYLMAGSTHLFGETEWALRLPSVVIGTVGIFVAYWVGRRFLNVTWSTAFAAAIAILPVLISVSQTARMYVFYVTLVMLFSVAIFRWERTTSYGSYFLAIGVCWAALSFHALSVFSTLLFFYPGLVRMSIRLLGLGGIALVACTLFQRAHSEWVGSHYFELVEVEPASGATSTALAESIALPFAAVGALVVASVAAFAYVVARRRRLEAEQLRWLVLSAVCLASAPILAYFLQYHLAGLAYIAGVIFFVRAGFGLLLPGLLGLALLVMFVAHAYVSWQLPEVKDWLDLGERLAGMPYPKPYLTFVTFAPLAAVIYAATISYFVVRFARGRPLPDHVLFFLVSVFAPLFLIGLFSGRYVPARYVIGFLPFFGLALFAGVYDLLNRTGSRLASASSIGRGAAVVVVLVALVNPRDLWYNVNPKSSDFAYLTDHRGVDHRGAAEFIKAKNLDSNDVVIAVDTQQQVYYLRERVDYLMRSLLAQGRSATFERDGRLYCLYTGVPQITNGTELEAVLLNPATDEVYIIGSGELASNQSRYFGDGIWDTMEAYGFESVFVGRDDATQVWHRAPGRSPTSSIGQTTAQSRPRSN